MAALRRRLGNYNMANLRALVFRTFLLLCLAHLSSGKLKVGDLNSLLWCRLGIRIILCWKHVLAVCLKCFSGWIARYSAISCLEVVKVGGLHSSAFGGIKSRQGIALYTIYM